MHRHLARRFSVALLLAAPLGGCSSDPAVGSDAGEGGVDGTLADGAIAEDALDAADAGNAEASDAADASAQLTDVQITTILYADNQIEIQEAQLALMRAIASQVRTFANEMI